MIGGNTLESEMCIAFVEYYPRSLDLTNCGTALAATAVKNFFGIQEMESEVHVNPIIKLPERFQGMSFTDVVRDYNWSSQDRLRFQDLMLNGEHDPYCTPDQE